MEEQPTADSQQPTATEQRFAREDELRDEEPLAGCDTEHCQRMRE